MRQKRRADQHTGQGFLYIHFILKLFVINRSGKSQHIKTVKFILEKAMKAQRRSRYI
jgi:hypothetical protein